VYLTAAQLQEYGAPDGDPFNNTFSTLDPAQLGQAILDAQNLVDGTTGTSYDDTDVPALIISLTAHIAAYYATMIYRKNVELAPRDPTVLRYQDAMTTLQGIAAGTINPRPLSEDQGGVAPGVISVANPYQGSLFHKRDFRLHHPGWRGERRYCG
jgi:phage gp36-like protein